MSFKETILPWLRAILWPLAGLFMSILPLSGLLVSLIKKGPAKVFAKKERPLPPKTLTDPRWGEHKYVHIPGVKMHYVEKGDKSKPLMVFVHGYPEFWFSWRYQLEYFSKDYWCVAPDNRGYGDTDKPSGVENYDIDLLAGDIHNLVKALGRDRCILVGHDWGGAIGYHVCKLYPDTVHNYIVLNLPHWESMLREMERGWDQRLKSWYIAFFQCPFIPEWFMKLGDMIAFDRMFADMNKPTEKEALEAYKFTFKDTKAFEKPINYYRHIVQNPRASNGIKLQVPVFSIFGTGDKYLSVAANKGSRDFIEDFEEEYLEGISHWVMLEAPDKVNKAMERYLTART